jgi:hypothetical protein
MSDKDKRRDLLKKILEITEEEDFLDSQGDKNKKTPKVKGLQRDAIKLNEKNKITLFGLFSTSPPDTLQISFF